MFNSAVPHSTPLCCALLCSTQRGLHTHCATVTRCSTDQAMQGMSRLLLPCQGASSIVTGQWFNRHQDGWDHNTLSHTALPERGEARTTWPAPWMLSDMRCPVLHCSLYTAGAEPPAYSTTQYLTYIINRVLTYLQGLSMQGLSRLPL